MKSNKVRVLSGIRASHSSLHLGNLLGAIEEMKKLQDNSKYETFYMVADLHAITTDFEIEELGKNRIAVATEYLATGIDPKKSVLFLQSDIPEHVELAYYLSTVISVHKLKLLPAYKDTEKLYKKLPKTMALLNYPVLMAADILMYKAEVVPIAKDQHAHLEVAQFIAKNMNSKYGTSFPEPKAYPDPQKYLDKKGRKMAPSIKGEGKMSKSKPGSAIFLSDSYDEVRRKILSMPTNTKGKGKQIPEEGDKVYAFFTMFELIFGKERRKELEKEYLGGGVRYEERKEELAKGIFDLIKPIQEKRKELEKNPEYIEKVLKEGAEKARKVAKKTLKEVKEKMGLL